MARKTIPLPAFCSLHHDWSPISAGSSQAAIAAVLAGFVFLGIVTVLTAGVPNRDDADRALRLLLAAFLGLAVTAYLFADLAGEQTCARAETEEALVGGMLGTFAIVMMVSLTWLLAAYKQEDNELFKYFRKLIYLASVFVVLLLTTNSQKYLSAALPRVPHTVFNSFVYGTGAASVVVPGVLAALCLKWKRLGKRAEEICLKVKQVAVKWCTRVALGYLTVSSLAAGVVLSISANSWYPEPAAWVAYSAALMALILPLAVLAFAMLALARPAPSGNVIDEAGPANAQANGAAASGSTSSAQADGNDTPPAPMTADRAETAADSNEIAASTTMNAE